MLSVLQRVSAWIFFLLVIVGISTQLPAVQQSTYSDTSLLLLRLIDLPLFFVGSLLASTSFILSAEDTSPRMGVRVFVASIVLLLFFGMILLNFYYPLQDFGG